MNWPRKTAARFKCKCGHSNMAHDRQKKGGWCTGTWANDTTFCDCDGYEADQGGPRKARGLKR